MRSLFLSLLSLLSACHWDAVVGEVVDHTPAEPRGPSHEVLGPLADPCGDDGWCWVMHEASGLPLTSMAASSPDNVWAVNGGNTVFRFDGEAWQARQIEDMNVHDVQVGSPFDVWLMGHHGGSRKAMHFDGFSLSPALLDDESSPRALIGTPSGPFVLLGSTGCRRVENGEEQACAPPMSAGTSSVVCTPPPDATWSLCTDEPYHPSVSVAGWGRGQEHWVGIGATSLWRRGDEEWEQVWPPEQAPQGLRAPLVGDVAPDGAVFMYSDITDTTSRVMMRWFEGEWTFWTVSEAIVRIAAASRDDAMALGLGSLLH